MKLLVIGKNGQLAHELSKLDVSAECLGRNEVDISNKISLIDTVKRIAPSAIINASAYTAVDAAETDIEAAELINHIAVANLCKAAMSVDAHLVHVSTDYVFSGDKGAPYLVDDEYAPIGIYGVSKMRGEQAIAKLYPQNSCIIRTSWVYSSQGNNFVKTMLRLMREKSELKVIDDQIGSPTSASALAKSCYLAASRKTEGTYHFTDAGVASWYDFAVAIQAQAIRKGMLKKAIPIYPVPTNEYPTPAKRPKYSVLDKTIFKAEFQNYEIQHWQTELDKVLDELT